MTHYTIYTIEASWLGGGLTPASIGKRLLSTFEQLGPLSNATRDWRLGDRLVEGWVPAAEAAPRMTELVEDAVWRDDDGDPSLDRGLPCPDEGYCVVSTSQVLRSDFGGPDSIYLRASVGGRWGNRLEFNVGGDLLPPDLSLVTFPIYHGALAALAANWPCPWALAYAYTPTAKPVGAGGVYPRTQQERYARLRKPFEVAWIAYISPSLAAGLAPPPEIAWQRTPGDGMILSAVQERVDQTNPEHLRRSRVLEAIMDERVGRVGPYRSQAAELPARVEPY
jgi:hypothetical protein